MGIVKGPRLIHSIRLPLNVLNSISQSVRLGTIFALTVLAVRGQAAPGNVSVNFLTVGVGTARSDLYYLATPGAGDSSMLRLEVAPNQASPTTYLYHGGAIMEIYQADKTTDPSIKGANQKFRPVGKVQFAKDGTYVIYFAITGDGTVTAASVSQTPADFPPGGFRIINVTGLPLEVQSHGQNDPMAVNSTVALPVGGSVLLPVNPAGTIRAFRTDKSPAEQIQQAAVDNSKATRFTYILGPDFSFTVIKENPAASRGGGIRSGARARRGSACFDFRPWQPRARAGRQQLTPAQRLREPYSKPSFSRPAGEIMCGVQGGSQTISTLAASTPGKAASLALRVFGNDWTHPTADRSERHFDVNLPAALITRLYLQVINESQIHDIYRNLGIKTQAQGVPYFILGKFAARIGGNLLGFAGGPIPGARTERIEVGRTNTVKAKGVSHR